MNIYVGGSGEEVWPSLVDSFMVALSQIEDPEQADVLVMAGDSPLVWNNNEKEKRAMLVILFHESQRTRFFRWPEAVFVPADMADTVLPTLTNLIQKGGY